MVQSLARVVRHVAHESTEHTLEDEDDLKREEEEEDKKDVTEPVAETEQHSHTDDTKTGSDKGDDGQTNTSWKATVLPSQMPSSPSHESIHAKLVQPTNESQSEKAITHNDAASSSSASPKKRARSEETSPSQAIATPDRPAKRRCLDIDKSTTDPDLSAPTVEDHATTMTNENDMGTLHAMVKRRRTESSLEYKTLKNKVDELQEELQTRKASLEEGTTTATESQNEVATREKVRDDILSNLNKLRRTIEHYETNKELLETLDHETRILVAKDHGRRLGEMKKELAAAGTQLQEAQRKLEAERKEVKQRIKEDEARLVGMEADLDLAHTEHYRWRCMEHLAVMKADDLKKVVAGLEKEGLGHPDSLEK
ncbi:hypothetical protein N0V84_011235 [Fusarium piperis]|uniref:Uncharacterized protein n=1 Tax=Fusarium piperis TaxID=1435070 RepID=A0A9W8TBL8_9HYPO|nr:hypothetical protein N0V84_011235 [Fusarium piperis]